MRRNDGKAVISSGVSSAHPLYSLSGKMTACLLDYKGTNTNTSFFSSFNRWSASFLFFLIKDHGYSHLPPDPKRSALYVIHLIHTQCSPNVISIAIYAIQWAHVLNVFSRSN